MLGKQLNIKHSIANIEIVYECDKSIRKCSFCGRDAFVKIFAKNRHSCTAVQLYRDLSVCVRGACVRVFVALGNGFDRKTAEEDLLAKLCNKP